MMAWLESTALATWTRESSSVWAYPTILTLHTVGLGIVVGAGTIIDLRLLGVARRVALSALRPLLSVIWTAFVVNAATGALLFAADATRKAGQPVFFVKLALIVGAVVITQRLGRLLSSPYSAATDVAPSGRALAAVSLMLWTGAIITGRLMAYL